MNQELTKKLFEKYPKIFSGKDKPVTENLMSFGFEHGDGWYKLIDGLCDHIQTFLDNNPHLNIPQVVATQVKEKFGTLSFYYDGGDEYIRGIISHAEWMSGTICEVCGSMENIGMTQGWLTTLCYEDWLKTNIKQWRNIETNELFEKDANGNIKVYYVYQAVKVPEHIVIDFKI